MKKVTFSCLALAILLQLIPSNGNAANIQDQKKKTNRTAMKQDTIPANLSKEPANPSKKEAEEGERNVMLNASDANKPREIQIGLPSEDVNVYENGLPAVYSSAVHKLAAHWRSDSSLGEVGLLSPSESAITTGNIAYSVNSFSKLGQKNFQGIFNYRTNQRPLALHRKHLSELRSGQFRPQIYKLHRPHRDLSCRPDPPLQQRTGQNIPALQTFPQ